MQVTYCSFKTLYTQPVYFWSATTSKNCKERFLLTFLKESEIFSHSLFFFFFGDLSKSRGACCIRVFSVCRADSVDQPPLIFHEASSESHFPLFLDLRAAAALSSDEFERFADERWAGVSHFEQFQACWSCVLFQLE